MVKILHSIKSWLSFWYKSGTIYNVQSPFVYDFLMHVLDTEKEFYIFRKLEAIRLQLNHDNTIVDTEDYGAGTRNVSAVKSVAAISRSSVSNPSKCRILFNMVNYLTPNTILEAGTSLGLSSAYMGSAHRSAKIITLEGNRTIANIAKETHIKAGLTNIEILTGRFEDNFEIALKKLNQVDLVFLDGHHLYEPTLQYFEKILPYSHSKTVLVLDDIYWSHEMTRAWEDIKSNPKVTLTIDIYHLGFVFFDPALSKEDISFIPFYFKPWRIGLLGK